MNKDIFLDDFIKGNVCFVIPYGNDNCDEAFVNAQKRIEQSIQEVLGSDFREDMILRVPENVRQENMYKWTTIYKAIEYLADMCEKKYGEYNWQKGIPPTCYIDSAVRHYLKWLRGDTDERHDRAFAWNIVCCMWEVNHHGVRNEKYAETVNAESGGFELSER